MTSEDREKIRSIETTVKRNIDNLRKEDVEELASLAMSRNENIQNEALTVLFYISQREPAQLLPATPALKSIIEDQSQDQNIRLSAAAIGEKIEEDPTVQQLISQVENDSSTGNRNSIRQKSAKAESSTVTVDRLKGRERHFYDVTQFMKPDEQPHFLFALTRSVLAADGCVVVDKHGSDMTLVDRTDTGSLLISDYGIRILTESGRWSITYQSITGIGKETSPTPTLKIASAGEVYRIRVAKSIHDLSQVSEAAELIERVTHSI